MAYKSATALQEKVNRLMSRTAGKPVLKPNKPLVLKGEVANRKMRRGGKKCTLLYNLGKSLFRYDNLSQLHSIVSSGPSTTCQGSTFNISIAPRDNLRAVSWC